VRAPPLPEAAPAVKAAAPALAARVQEALVAVRAADQEVTAEEAAVVEAAGSNHWTDDSIGGRKGLPLPPAFFCAISSSERDLSRVFRNRFVLRQ
jgi:hypothetical protein